MKLGTLGKLGTVVISSENSLTNLDTIFPNSDLGNIASGSDILIDLSGVTADGGVDLKKVVILAPVYQVMYNEKSTDDNDEVAGNVFATIAPTVFSDTVINLRIEITDGSTNSVSTKNLSYTVNTVVGTMNADTGADLTGIMVGQNITLPNISTASVGRKSSYWEQVSGPYVPELIAVKNEATPTIPFPDPNTATMWADDLAEDFGAGNLGVPKLPLAFQEAFHITYDGVFVMNAVGESNGGDPMGTLAVSADGNSLYMIGQKSDQAVAKFTIPTNLTKASTVATMVNATIEQNYIKLLIDDNGVDRMDFEGKSAQDRVNRISGLYDLGNDTLLCSCHVSYDGGRGNTLNLFKVDLASSTYQPDGFYELQGASFATGGISAIPPELLADFTGDLLVGGGTLDSIQARFSKGHSQFTFSEQDAINADKNVTQEITSTQVELFIDENDLIAQNIPSSTQPKEQLDPIYTTGTKSLYGFYVPNTNKFVALGRMFGMHHGIYYKGLETDFGVVQPGPHRVVESDAYNYFWMVDADAVVNGDGSTRFSAFGKVDWGFTPVANCIGAVFCPVNDRLYVALRDAGNTNENGLPAIVAFTLRARDENTPAFVRPTDCTFKLTETNSEGLVDTTTITAFADGSVIVNTPPEAFITGNQTVTEGDVVTINLTGTDPQGDTLTYEFEEVSSSGVSTTIVEGVLTFTAPAGNSVITFRGRVNDGEFNSDWVSTAITVGAEVFANNPPVASISPTQTVGAGQTAVLTVIASDVDGDTLTYSFSKFSGPSITLSGSGNTRTFVAPSEDFEQTIVIDATVSDGTESVTVRQTLTVQAQGEVNTAPTLAIAANKQTYNAGETAVFSANVTDTVGDTHTYLWSTGATTQQVSIAMAELEADSQYTISCVATDQDNAESNAASIAVDVLAQGQAAPVITVSTTGTIILVKDTYFETPTSEVNDPSNPDAEATVTSTLNSSVTGTYTITYSYTGATSVVVNVLVVEGITVPTYRQITVH